jgi:uncharacterized protein (DUF305 family)
MKRHRLVAVAGTVLLLAAGLAGCQSTDGPAGPAGTSAAAAPGSASTFNDTDVMFLQMSLSHMQQGYQVVKLAKERGGTAEVRNLAAAMDATWGAEADTMSRWLTGWQQPLTPDPNTGVHAGHGDLHSLRPSDIEQLRKTAAADFDTAALNMLIGHLHNSVEVARLEATGGAFQPAKDLAAAMTKARMAQIQQMLRMVADGASDRG